MAAEADDFFGEIDFIRIDGHFLQEPVFIGNGGLDLIHEGQDFLFQPFFIGLDDDFLAAGNGFDEGCHLIGPAEEIPADIGPFPFAHGDHAVQGTLQGGFKRRPAGIGIDDRRRLDEPVLG